MAAGFKTATVNAADVPGTLTDYPAYVDLSRLGITTQAEADSVRVYADSGKSTQWAREIVSASQMWVKVPSLTSTTAIYVDWDGVSADYAATDTYGRNAVWSNYASVWHLEAGSGTRIDSKANTNDVTGTTRGAVAALVGNGNDFEESSSDVLSKASPTGLGGVSTISVEVVINAESLTDALPCPIALWNDNSVNQRAWAIAVIVADANKIRFYTSDDGVGADSLVGGAISLSTTYVLTATFQSGTNNMILYQNADTYQKTSTETSIFNSTTDIRIGGANGFGGGGTGIFWDGWIDEARVTTNILSANYHTTKYNNLTDESGFWGTWTTVSGQTFTSPSGGVAYTGGLTMY